MYRDVVRQQIVEYDETDASAHSQESRRVKKKGDAKVRAVHLVSAFHWVPSITWFPSTNSLTFLRPW